jgi:acetylornithine deacetylase
MSGARLTSQDLLARLVAFDTTSRLSNLPLIDFVRDYFNHFGIESQLIPDASGTKANLHAVVGGDDAEPAVILSGHTDVVPAKADDWSFDPFSLTERDGKLYGRGSTDMKGFLASSLAAVPDILAAKLVTPVSFAFSYDEEVGCLGVPSMIAEFLESPALPFLCIVGEPTNLVPVLGHKGKTALRCQVNGVEAHSAMTHLGANAIEAAARIIAKINDIAQTIAQRGPSDPGFNPPFTTLQTSRITGGTATNIIPNYCCFEFEMRNLPNEAAEPILASIKKFAERDIVPSLYAQGEQGRVEWDMTFSYPGLEIDASSEAARLVCRITGREPGQKVSYGTEAGLFHEAGIPTVVCGPGSIEQAHRPDEYLAVEQLLACDRFLRALITDLADGNE